MSDEELKKHIQVLVKELTHRHRKHMAMLPPPENLCSDLYELSNAVQQALIDNNCQPL